MDSLANLVPALYANNDVDGSLAAVVSAYDEQHGEQLAIMEELQSLRTPNTSPLEFLPNIADALGSPFPFMSAKRWQRGNKLDNLPYIYSLRGSAQGIVDTVRYLTGVSIELETDDAWSWILGVSTLPGGDPYIRYINDSDSSTTATYAIVEDHGALEAVSITYDPKQPNGITMSDTDAAQGWFLGVVRGQISITAVPGAGVAEIQVIDIDNTIHTVKITDGQITVTD